MVDVKIPIPQELHIRLRHMFWMQRQYVQKGLEAMIRREVEAYEAQELAQIRARAEQRDLQGVG